MPRRKDIWQVGIVQAPAADLLAGVMREAAVRWLPPEPAYTFLADPFGMWHAGALHLFVEQYDYRTRHGRIERLVFDDGFALVERTLALREPWHLSYPLVFEAEGAQWMLPEAHRSGTLTLYRAHGPLEDWRAECTIALDCVPVDASILRHGGRWWLFYASATSKASKVDDLHVAWADRLTGPWTTHPANPVRSDRSSTRPGGTPLVVGERIMLPVQDCTRTYGGAVRPLWIDRLDETGFLAQAGEPLPFPKRAPAACEGMHTLSACGPVTLIDVKTVDRSISSLRIELGRLLRRPFDR